MKTQKWIHLGLMTIAVVGLSLGSCNKNKKTADDKDTQSASDNQEAETMSNDISNMSDAAANGVDHFRVSSAADMDSPLSLCATVTKDSILHTITIDFGSANCTCADGRNRRGVINIAYTGSFFVAGFSRTVTFTDYYVNDKKVEGTHTVTFNGQNSAGNYNWTINAVNMKITRTDGRYHTWNSTRNREMTAGAGTLLLRSDDVYSITGTANGTNINGVAYTANITTPLVRAVNCHWFQSGTVVIVPTGRPSRTLDFGAGTCDNAATVTIGSNVYNITLD